MYEHKIRHWWPLAVVAGLAIGLFTNSLLAQAPGVGSNLPTSWGIPLDSIKRTYTQTVSQLSASGTASSDIVQLCGAAGITTKITKVNFGGRATAVQPVDVVITKRSSLDASGTVYNGAPFGALSQPGIAYDTGDSASQSSVTPYVTTPTQLGTLVGVVSTIQVYLGNLTTGTSPASSIQLFGDRPSKAPTLRSATQCAVVGISPAVIVQGGLFDITLEWTEE